ncbi:MAG TPA: hypothetical protein PKV87_11575 [Pseudomonadales bacterium]|nr:hypothetical protein [Pseudomonadales bacterium]
MTDNTFRYSAATQWLIGLTLALLMAATRSHHFASLDTLPSASWAVFFLAGLYLTPRWAVVGLLAEAALLDYAAITWGGVSSFCVTPAYLFLLPAYGTLWLAGRWYGQRHPHTIRLLPLLGSVALAGLVCELWSGGSFYFLGGRFGETSLAVFGQRLLTYLPSELFDLFFYVAIAVLLQWLIARAAGRLRPIAA